MNKKPSLTTKLLLPALAALLLLASVACGATPAATQPGQLSETTQVVTRLVTQDVTQMVTRIVELPVTATPGPSATPTATPDPNSIPVTTGLPKASLPDRTDCLYGPAPWYEYKTSFPAGQAVDLVGKSDDGGWLNIQAAGGWNTCWVSLAQAGVPQAQVEALPVVQPVWPLDYFDLSSPYAEAVRSGDEITLSWKAVYMSADEVRGYLIRAKLCQGGQLVSQDIFVPVTFAENTGTIRYKLTDEAGCSAPSDVHIISYARRGFAFYYKTGKLGWEKVWLPPHP